MSVTEAVLATVQALSPEQQKKVLEYAQTLQREENSAKTASKPISWRDHPFVGMWKDRKDMV